MRTPLIAILALTATLVSSAPTYQGKNDVLAAIKRDILLESKSLPHMNGKREIPKMTIHTNYTKKRGQVRRLQGVTAELETSALGSGGKGVGKRGKVVERIAKAPPKTDPPTSNQQQQQPNRPTQQQSTPPSQEQSHSQAHPASSPSSSSTSKDDTSVVPVDQLGLGLDSEILHPKRQVPEDRTKDEGIVDGHGDKSEGQSGDADDAVVEEKRADGRILKKRGKIYWLEDPLDARQWGGARELSDEDDEPIWY